MHLNFIKTILQEKEAIHCIHCTLVRKFVPQAMKILAAKAAVNKEWEKLEKILAEPGGEKVIQALMQKTQNKDHQHHKQRPQK